MKNFELRQALLSKRALIPAVAALAVAGCGGGESNTHSDRPVSTTTPTPAKAGKPNLMGYDVSYPNQTDLPKPGAFAIVGLNGTNAATFNPYFKRQLAWAMQSAGGTDQPKAAVYVHTANPGPAVPDWPQSGENDNGVCRGGNTVACAVEYGKGLAKRDVARLGNANAHTVWLDVEGAEDGYSWQPSTTKNAAAVEGMVEEFEANGNAVGIYSGTYDYRATLGDTKEAAGLTGLPDWILGATNLADAKANCHVEGFTGQVVIAQIAGETLDKDITC